MTIRDGDFILVDYDHFSGRSVWSMYDGKQTIYRVDYPVENIVKQNKASRNDAPSGWKGDWHRIASVPLNLVHDGGLAEAMNQHDDKWISRMLNNPDNRAWRTKEGAV